MRRPTTAEQRRMAADLAGSICVGCGCTDDCACDGGCSWLMRDGEGSGVCSNCQHVLPAYAGSAALVGFYPDRLPAPLLDVRLNEVRLQEYRAGASLPEGTYFVLNEDAGTVRLVDQCGLPAQGACDALRVDVDWETSARWKSATLSRKDSADRRRGRQLKTERGRARAKAAKKARQAQRRRS